LPLKPDIKRSDQTSPRAHGALKIVMRGAEKEDRAAA